jgi:primosomal protein N' (replication factor Y)
MMSGAVEAPGVGPQVAKVVVERSPDRAFDYRIPFELAGRVRVGCRVRVSFGVRVCHGYVVGLPAASDQPRLKPILDVEGDGPILSPALLDLARWIAGYYVASLESTLRTVLPGPVRQGVREKRVLVVRAVPPAGPVPKLPPAQQRVLDALAAGGEAPVEELRARLGISAAPIRGLAAKGLIGIDSLPAGRADAERVRILPTEPLPLMPQQAEALGCILSCVDRQSKPRATEESAGSPREPHVVLLHGVTGSGKTEVYLQAIEAVRAGGRGAIVLVPEIALTPQTVERFVSRFGDRVAVLHSHLAGGERHDAWHRVRAGGADIVVGARSAVFAPVRNLGLIVVDEEHEPSYKQDEAPRYHARDVAVMRGRLEGCAVVLGSATPSLESWQNVAKAKYLLAELPHRVDHRLMPRLRIVDMRGAVAGKGCILSPELVAAMRARLERGEQCMLFLNRRGYATSLQCPACGFVAACGNCSVSFTYHRAEERLRCHVCGCGQVVPPKCPGCGDPKYRFAGFGTQRIETVVQACLPKARVRRMDSDVTRRRAAYEEILGDFRSGKTDILIGTQMIAKGLHFPNVTLVGVVHADLSLHMPDFRAGERTFQLLAQVAGRAGRGDVPGEVIIQTCAPHHPAIQAVRRMDFAGFCDQEMEMRRELGYPPCAHLACVLVHGVKQEAVAAAADALSARLRADAGQDATVAEACPAPLSKAKNRFRYQVLLRGRSALRLGNLLRAALAGTRLHAGVVASVDMDALDLR